MKKLIIMLALAPMALSLSACKRGHSKNPIAAATEAAKDKDLQRTWQSDCSMKPLDAIWTGLMSGGEAAVKSNRVLYTFSGNNLTRTSVFYSQTDCAQEAWIFTERGVFKIDDKQKSNDGGKHIDFDMRRLTLIVRDDSGAKAANAIKLCQKSDWSANSKEMDVTKPSKDATCYGAEVPRKIPTIYRIDSGVLHLGNPSMKAGERPSTLNFGSKLTAK